MLPDNDILSEINITEYKIPLISKDNPSLETFEVSKMSGRIASAEMRSEYHRNSRSSVNQQYIDGMRTSNDGNFETSNYISNSLKNAVINIEYSIEIPYSITSDGKDHSIRIKESIVPVNYVYYAVPKLDGDAFLTAEIANWNMLNLIPGKSSIYYQRTYTGETYLDSGNINDTLIVSLGRDKGISLKRESNKEIFDKKFIGNNIRETIGWNISVRNNKNSNIKIIIEDQFPLSSRKSIEIERLEYYEAELNDRTGKVTWELKLKSNEKKDLSFKYSVKYPKYSYISTE